MRLHLVALWWFVPVFASGFGFSVCFAVGVDFLPTGLVWWWCGCIIWQCVLILLLASVNTILV